MNKESSKLRLQVFLSHNENFSRRDAMEIIQSGVVEVNGEVVKEPSYPVDETKDRIYCRGKFVKAKPFVYILLNKPKNYVTTKEDSHAEKTVFDLLPRSYHYVAPVGRLDKDTEGLLLLTNDGDVAFWLTHPRFKVDKTYYVCLPSKLELEQKMKLESGVFLEKGQKTAPCRIQIFKTRRDFTDLRITIHEGRNRQVRRMFDKVGHEVKYLQRITQGPLTLGNLKPGMWRLLSNDEIFRLRELIESRNVPEQKAPNKVVRTHQIHKTGKVYKDKRDDRNQRGNRNKSDNLNKRDKNEKRHSSDQHRRTDQKRIR